MVETRVEKFKEYRSEIQSSFNDYNSTKKKTSDRIDKIMTSEDNKNTSSISFDELMGAHELYEKIDDKKVSPLKGRKKVSIPYLLISISICCILLAITIWLGILTFGGQL